jgi:hypothetical protein
MADAYARTELSLPRETRSLLPAMLAALGVVMVLGGWVLVERQKRNAEAARAAVAVESEKQARAERSDMESAKHELETRVQELQRENARLSARVAARAAPVETARGDKKAEKKAGRKHHKRH